MISKAHVREISCLNAKVDYTRNSQSERRNLSGYGTKDARQLIGQVTSAWTKLCCIAAGVTGQRDGAEDIVQQACAIAIEKNQSFESEGQFVMWLAGVVRRCALNERRKFYRRRTSATDPVTMANVQERNQPADVTQRSGELSENQMEFDDQVLAALNQLSADARTCLLLRTVEQLNYQEISELLAMPQGTAMSLVHRSRAKLRRLLADRNSRPPGSQGGDDD